MSRRWPIVFSLASLSLLSGSAAAEPEQPYDFAAAVENRSTSPSFVLITVIDDGRHTDWTGCVLANVLVGALEMENGVADKGARKIAIASKDRVFHFSNGRALETIAAQRESTKNQRACRIVRSGLSAYSADRSGEVSVGLPFGTLAKTHKRP